jgi:hypothetical protein
MYEFIINLSIADCIQILIFCALFWYSWETRQLRKWQKRQVQLTILDLDMQRVRSAYENRGNPTPYGEKFPIIIRKIYELGKFNPKVLYCNGFHSPLNLTQKIAQKIKIILKYQK